MIRNLKIPTALAGLALAVTSHLQAALELPKLFTDNMVLQRGKPIAVWGRAEAGQKVMVSLRDRRATAVADDGGEWSVALEAMSHGGPYTLEVASGGERTRLENVLVGDVWLCSGQSNMEWPLRETEEAAAAIAAGERAMIRLFTVERETAFLPQDELPGGQWLECRPETVKDFSAVGYYFGKALVKELDVPIGLINSSWGGTDIEPWTSWETMSSLERYKDLDPVALQRTAEEDRRNQEQYLAAVEADRGLREEWFQPDSDLSHWKPIEVPSKWESTEIGHADGVAWFRKDFQLPSELAGKPATLHIGPVDDQDFTYLNGKFIGSVNSWDLPRSYAIEAGLLRKGANALVVKVYDPRAGGGMHGQPDDMYLKIGGERISLAGDWIYRPSALTTDFGTLNLGPNSVPSQIYNAMIHPLVDFSIKGVIWYQGENNAERAYDYRKLFPLLIEDWRAKWGETFPFYWVQLASFLPESKEPEESSWAELREAQHMALALPRTGQAVAIDIGDADDIHPRNKRAVGERLALVALHDSYGRDVVFSGPLFKRMRVKGRHAVLEFAHVDGGLVAGGSKYGYLKGFAVAGEDRKFVWAQARIDGERVIVSAAAVKNPVAVRYAWANNPEDANLFNQAGLPAAPFRTDDWSAVTQQE